MCWTLECEATKRHSYLLIDGHVSNGVLRKVMIAVAKMKWWCYIPQWDFERKRRRRIDVSKPKKDCLFWDGEKPRKGATSGRYQELNHARVLPLYVFTLSESGNANPLLSGFFAQQLLSARRADEKSLQLLSCRFCTAGKCNRLRDGLLMARRMAPYQKRHRSQGGTRKLLTFQC